MVEKALYYSHVTGVQPIECAPIDNGAGPQLSGPHAAAIAAIPDDDPGFVAWLTECTFKLRERELDEHIESVAAAKQYGTATISPRASCMARASISGPWQAEGVAYAQWVDACYLKAGAIIDAVQAGQRPVPTKEELLAEMPVMVWP